MPVGDHAVRPRRRFESDSKDYDFSRGIVQGYIRRAYEQALAILAAEIPATARRGAAQLGRKAAPGRFAHRMASRNPERPAGHLTTRMFRLNHTVALAVDPYT
ncbi:MAG: hypothetical protein HYW10_00055 [Candidatus Omnitrophica bacterium]|nr:hypothetical protein [Candidatus Omnitrophota bacterium]